MKIDQERFCWEIRRNGKVCAYAQSHRAAESIIRQLKKIHRHAEFKAAFIGRPIPHCGDKGQAL